MTVIQTEHESPASELAPSPLQELLRQPVQSTPSTQLPSIVLGRIVSINETGQAHISLPSLSSENFLALSLCALQPEQIGSTCAVQFINGETSQPLIMGLVQEASTQLKWPGNASEPLALTVSDNGQRVQIEAVEELVLQCGEARIVMSAQGLIEIRAPYIDSHALATQRLRGGSVQVN